MGDVVIFKSRYPKTLKRLSELRARRLEHERRVAEARVLAPAVEALERYFETGVPPSDWPAKH